MKLVKILSALAVIAAAGMVAAGCNSPAGSENAVAEAAGLAPESAGAPLVAGAAGTKTIKVKFEVKNGGMGLMKTEGMLAARDWSRIVYDSGAFANDYTITITVPASDEYVRIFWKATEYIWFPFYLWADMKAESCTITLDYNGNYKVATKNLIWPDVNSGNIKEFDPFTQEYVSAGECWNRLKSRSVHD